MFFVNNIHCYKYNQNIIYVLVLSKICALNLVIKMFLCENVFCAAILVLSKMFLRRYSCYCVKY